MHELGVDLLSGTGRKWLRGPRGTGVLVVRREVADRLRPRLVDLHSATWEAPDTVRLRDDARVYELWEYSIADRLGLVAAARCALALGMPAVSDAVAQRAAYLRSGLAELPGVEVRDLGRQRCGIVTLGVKIFDEAGEVRDEFHGEPALPRAVAPNESCAVTIERSCPAAPGRYSLKIDLIDQHICWFEERGSRPLTLPLVVA